MARAAPARTPRRPPRPGGPRGEAPGSRRGRPPRRPRTARPGRRRARARSWPPGRRGPRQAPLRGSDAADDGQALDVGAGLVEAARHLAREQAAEAVAQEVDPGVALV